MTKNKENKIPNANYRKDNIPKWINAYAILMILFLISRAALLYIYPAWILPEISNITYADGLLIKSLAASHLMMTFLVFSAYGSQNSMFLVFGYMINMAVNIQLLIILPYYLGFTSFSGLLSFAVILFFIIIELRAIIQLRKLTIIPFKKIEE